MAIENSFTLAQAYLPLIDEVYKRESLTSRFDYTRDRVRFIGANVVQIYKATMDGLNSAEGYIRRLLAKNLNLRNTPEIRFILDESIEYGVNMSKLIDDVAKKDASGRVHTWVDAPDRIKIIKR